MSQTETVDREVAPLEPLTVRKSTAAKLLDVSDVTVWRLVKAGKLETVKLGNMEDERITMESIKRLAAPKTREAA